MNIVYLKDYPQFIPRLTKWFFNEWSYLVPELTEEDVEKRIRSRLQKGEIPLTLLAMEDGALLGTVSLKVHDMETHKHFTPWLAALYVKRTKRNRGIGSRLVEAAEEIAAGLGIDRLYLYTPQAENFYANLGWNLTEKTKFNGHSVSIMNKKISRK